MARKESTVIVQGTKVRFFTKQEADYISLTDITKHFPDGTLTIPRWLRNRNTLEFIGMWEQLNNEGFVMAEYENLHAQSGLNRFSLSAKRWIEKTKAIGLKVVHGKGAATYAHKDIAVQFAFWLSPTFQLFLIKEFQRLKLQEAKAQKEALEWNIKRTLAKVNYKIHTDAIKENLIPERIDNILKNEGFVYAGEADVLNVAVFGITAKMWRLQNPKKKGNIRDHAIGEQLLVLANLESHNAQFIKEGLNQDDRAEKLNKIAIYQMQVLANHPALKQLINKSK